MDSKILEKGKQIETKIQGLEYGLRFLTPESFDLNLMSVYLSVHSQLYDILKKYLLTEFREQVEKVLAEARQEFEQL